MKKHSQKSLSVPVLGALAFCLAMPTPALAVCEYWWNLSSDVATVTAQQTAAATASSTQINTAVTAGINATTTSLEAEISAMDDNVRQTMADWWERYREAMQQQAAQINAARIDQMRQMGSVLDSQMQTATQTEIQRQENKIARSYQISSDLSCVTDTLGKAFGSSANSSRALSNAYSRDYGRMWMNSAGTPTANGPAAAVKSYFSDYCEYVSGDFNDGVTGCPTPQTDPRYIDADIAVGDVIFKDYTIKMEDPKIMKAANVITRNIAGIKSSDVINQKMLTTAAGEEGILRQRSIAAQANVAQSLITTIIAERSPSAAPAPQIQALRIASGIDASRTHDNPSEREIRQAMIDQLRSPTYYQEMAGGEEEILRHETELRMFNLLQMYRLMERMERMALLSASQFGAKLDRTNTIGSQDSSSAAPNQ